MPYSTYDSYLSNLDSLVFDAPSEVIQSEKDVADELDLWSNAQFTFDVKPGVGIYDEEKTKSSPATTTKNSPAATPAAQFESDSGLDPVTYDTLVNYLDYELPRQQQVKLDPPTAAATTPVAKKQRIQPRPLAPALPLLAPSVPAIQPAVAAIAPATTARQVLMPKPPSVNTSILPSLLATANNSSSSITIAPPTVPKKSSKRAHADIESANTSEKNVNLDEDKRRRNTAASARFRVKKKMREQAMEQSVREMTLKSDKLQDRVNHLESEIKYLRSLLLDKTATTGAN